VTRIEKVGLPRHFCHQFEGHVARKHYSASILNIVLIQMSYTADLFANAKSELKIPLEKEN